jgi:hypothetical protein
LLMECTLTSTRPTIVPSSSMELDRFVDGVHANPHLTRLAVSAWGLALEITLLLERTLRTLTHPEKPHPLGSRMTFSDQRPHNQERRSSARHGSQYQRCATTIEYRSATDERTTKSGGRQPAVLCTRWSVAHGVRQITCKHVSRTTGGLRPRSWLHPRVSSRMRGCALQRRFVCHGGLTPPALDCCTIVRPWNTAFCDAQTHIRSRAPGVSPPWFVTPTLYRENRASFGDGRTDNDEERRA